MPDIFHLSRRTTSLQFPFAVHLVQRSHQRAYCPQRLQVGREERHAGSHGLIYFLCNMRRASPGRCGSSPGLVVVG
jgi:hypothetical protein